MPTIFLTNDADGTTSEYHQYYVGNSGPFLIPVGQKVQVRSGVLHEGDPADEEDALPLRSSAQIYVETAPSEDNHVLRLADLLAGIVEAIIFGYGGTKYWKLYVDPITHDFILAATQDDGVSYEERNRWQLINS